jgi:hypothetical protein
MYSTDLNIYFEAILWWGYNDFMHFKTLCANCTITKIIFSSYMFFYRQTCMATSKHGSDEINKVSIKYYLCQAKNIFIINR